MICNKLSNLGQGTLEMLDIPVICNTVTNMIEETQV